MVWVRVLSLHLDRGGGTISPGWERELRDEWLLQSSQGFAFGRYYPRLDNLLTDESRVDFVLGASDRAIQCLRAFGPYVPAAFMNGIGAGEFRADWPIQWFERLAERFRALLREELPMDYERTGPCVPMNSPGQNFGDIEPIRMAEPHAAPNGGPAERQDNSDAGGGPPSVS